MQFNPGLLPLQLGTAYNKIDSWTFIQIFDLTNIIEEFLTLTKRSEYLKTVFKNDVHDKNFAIEFHNSLRILNSLQNKIATQINQFNPKNKRFRRGLVNGLGTLIKSLTGNLDVNDAEKYDTSIKLLSDNQTKIKTIVKDQITILQNSIKKFTDNVQNLKHNQIILESRIIEIEQILKNTKLTNIETYDYFLIHTIAQQLTMNFQIIYDIFEKIEVAISFAKLNTFHNSIVEPIDLLNEIKLIESHISKGKLPFEPELENILYLEKIIEIKSYHKENQIIFMIEIPIVEAEHYSYYHLYPLPVPKNNSFQVIVPHSQFLILNEQSYMFFDTSCQEIRKETFFCHEANPAKIQHDMQPCEVQLIQYSKNTSNCLAMQLILTKLKIQNLDENKWLIVSPENEVAVQECDSTKKNILLKGTYVLELNPLCELTIQNFKIRTYKKPKTIFKKIELPQLNFNNTDNLNKHLFEFKPLKLNDIDLNNLKNVQNNLDLQNQRLTTISDPVVHYQNISVWTLIIYILIIMFVVIFVAYYVRNHHVPLSRRQQEQVSLEMQEEKPPEVLPSPRVLL